MIPNRRSLGNETGAAREAPPDVEPGLVRNLAFLAGARVFAFCALGSPGQFVASLRHLGAQVVGFAPFPDHHVFTSADIAKIESAAVSTSATALVTTEKDFRRLEGCSFRLPLHVLHIKLEMNDPGHRLEEAIGKVARG